MNVLARLGEVAESFRNGSGFKSSLAALSALGDDLETLPRTTRSWLRKPALATVTDAIFKSLEDRDPSYTAAPARMVERPMSKSHPKAMSLRMNNLTATAGGRALMRLAPHLALMSMEEVDFSTDEFKKAGATYRKETAFFAALLSSVEGRKATMLAAALAQKEWTERFWRRDTDKPIEVDHLVVGNGPVGTAFAHGLIDEGGFSPLIVSEENPGGPFAWGSFPLNHRSRPVSAVGLGGPATSWALDDLGPVLISPSDINTTQGYGMSDIVAAATALNAMAAGPTVTARIKDYRYSYDDESRDVRVFEIENMDSGEERNLRVARQATFATGMGQQRSLSGYGDQVSVKDLLAKPDPSSLGEVVAVVGDGDSAMMSIAHLLGLHGSNTTPRQAHKLAKIVWIRKSGLVHKETLPIVGRLRYGEIAPFLPRLLDPAYPSMIQVVDGRVYDANYRGGKKQLRCRNDKDPAQMVEVDAVVNATGFAEDYIDYFLDFDGPVVYNYDDLPLAREAVGGERVYTIGAAARLPVTAEEQRRFPILRNSTLAENSAALFRTIPSAVAFARQSVNETERSKRSLSGLFAEPRNTGGSESLETFERSLDYIEPGAVSTHASVQSHLRLMVAALGEEVPCAAPISIEIEMESDDTLRVTAGQVPSHVIERVLNPVFDDEGIRRGLLHLCKTVGTLEETSETLLKERALSQSFVLTIPVRKGRLAATGVTLAA